MGSPSAVTAPNLIRFHDYEVDLRAGRLHKSGIRIGLREKSFQVLAALLEQPGEVVTREALRQRLWPDDVFVDFENNLNTAVARLRVALNDSAENPRFIETLPKRGYRFVGSLSKPSPPRLLVLPFANLTGDPGQDYLCDAMTEEVITELAILAPEQLAVIARTTAMHYGGSQKVVSQIGRELAVDYVVEGSVRRSNDRMALSAQLIQASDETHLFARTYYTTSDDIFEVKSEAAQAVAAQIGIVQPQPPRKPTNDFQAYNCYVQGRYHSAKATPKEMETGRQLFEEAIARDPEFALAYDALAELHWTRGFVGLTPPKEACAAGMPYASRAIAIDDTLAETHALLGQFHKSLDYNWPRVHKELTRAMELNAASSTVRLRYAVDFLMPHGRVEEAISEIERALELDPLSLYTLNWMAVMLVLAHQYDRAIDQTRVLHEFYPDSHWGYLVLGVAHREKQNFSDSIAAHRKAAELSGDSPLMLGWLGLALAKAGEQAEARGLLERLHEMEKRTYVPPTSLAWIYLGLEELDRAFEWMDRGVDARDEMMMAIKNYAFFNPIRSDPRYFSLLRKMNLSH